MPDISPSFSALSQLTFTSPNVGGWYFAQNIGLVPDTVAPFLAAHGFLVNGGTEHYIAGEFAGYLLNMERNKFSRLDAMQILLNTMVDTFNEGRSLNSTRYNDLLTNLQSLLSNNQADVTSFLNTEVTNSSGYVTLMLSTKDQLATDYTSHAATATAFLTGLGVTELARINEEYDDKEASINQQVLDKGLYSSLIPTQVAVQIARERSERITDLNDKLNREKWENQHRLYEQQFRMRVQGMQTLLSTGQWKADLLKYQLDTRSNLALALFGIVERREDDYPGIGDMSALITAMGDDQ